MKTFLLIQIIFTLKTQNIINQEVLKMSDKKTIIADELMEAQLNENSRKLNVSLNELIERYIKRGLYSDDYYVQPPFSKEEIDEIFKKNMERDKKSRIFPKNYNLM